MLPRPAWVTSDDFRIDKVEYQPPNTVTMGIRANVAIAAV